MKLMKKFLWLILLIILLAGGNPALAQEYESVAAINAKDWVKYFDDLLGYRYDSHGCLHFSPSDIYLLYKTIPPGVPLEIKHYVLKKNDPPFVLEGVAFLSDKTAAPDDINKHALTFKNYPTELIFYPSLNLLVILVNGFPYAKVNALAGPPYDFLMAFDVKKDGPIQWDFMLSTPTDPGKYTFLKPTDHYLSSAYYKNTVVPFSAWIEKIKGTWSYQKNGRWYKAPENVAADLERPAEDRIYNYYDINLDQKGKVSAARYAGHDFGKYVLLWTADGKNRYPEMGYAAGELVFEQIILVKDLVDLLTASDEDDFETCVSENADFTFYKELSEFKRSSGQKIPDKGNRTAYSYYKLFNRFKLSAEDRRLIDQRLIKALDEYRENRLPRNREARAQTLGLYNYLRVNSLVLDKQAHWYDQINDDWEFFRELRVKLRQDFDKMGILSQANRQNIIEGWLNDRLEFKPISPPRQGKYVQELSISAFFKPDEESTLFSERERAVMVERIGKAVKGGKGEGLNLNIVDALNGYNFGQLLNEILGDLYKSHGCMHVSPRNMLFLYELLPVGAQMTVYPYSKKVSQEALSSIPLLADLVNFSEDLEKLKENFKTTNEVQVAVYPFSGDWIIYVKQKPFTRLRIRGGPQTKFYLVQGRDKQGKPIFEDNLAYPTSSGSYYIFRKTQDYVSNIYHDQTVIPMGGVISKEEGKWSFLNKKGERKPLPKAIEQDLANPPEKRAYTYYDTVKNASGETVGMKWGSHSFGKFSIQTTLDRRNPFPELIHSSGDLMMEERQLINELIKILAAPHDELDQCLKYSQNFDLYKTCYLFMQDPKRGDLIQPRESGSYKLYFGLPLNSAEKKALPPDVMIANQILRNEKLSESDIKLLINEGIAYRRSGKLKINMEKIIGLQYDTYQYVVTIQKFANHYSTLNNYWEGLSGIRKALLTDFNNFVLKDPNLFHNFMREQMLKRTQLEKISQEKALQMLYEMLSQN